LSLNGRDSNKTGDLTRLLHDEMWRRAIWQIATSVSQQRDACSSM
jgi:hypothetical protein